MALSLSLLRHLFAGHAHLDLLCELSAEAAEHERAAHQDALRSRDETIAALKQALELARAGGGGGAGFVTRAEADAQERAGVAGYRKAHAFDPFARMQPLRHAPSEGSTASGGGVGGGVVSGASSPTSSTQSSKRAFKAAVAEFYGLACADSPDALVDMLGERRAFHEVELAHVWPASYQDFGPYAREMALPGDFFTQPRNYLLLPKDLHQAFDSARVCLIPCSAGIRVRVLRPEGLCARVAAMDGALLHLPHAADSPPRVPFKRILGWMAWLAKGARDLAPEAEQDMSEALEASGSAEGNTALRSLVATAERSGYRSGTA